MADSRFSGLSIHLRQSYHHVQRTLHWWLLYPLPALPSRALAGWCPNTITKWQTSYQEYPPASFSLSKTRRPSNCQFQQQCTLDKLNTIERLVKKHHQHIHFYCKSTVAEHSINLGITSNCKHQYCGHMH